MYIIVCSTSLRRKTRKLCLYFIKNVKTRKSRDQGLENVKLYRTVQLFFIIRENVNFLGTVVENKNFERK